MTKKRQITLKKALKLILLEEYPVRHAVSSCGMWVTKPITELKECGWSSILGATMEFGSFSSLSCSDLVSFSVKRQTSSIWLEVCRLIKQN